jgi:DNA-binding winged helix-turn-helix (wHTH) protein/tetratricopeptide (TPR) repeat protein
MAREFRIANWLITPDLNQISEQGRVVSIEPKVMEVLLFLAANPGEVLSKDRILKEVWRDTFVGDEVLTYSMSELRKALGDDAKNPRFIATIQRRGYRLIAPVQQEPAPPAAAVAPASKAVGVNRRFITIALAALTIGLIAFGSWFFRPAPALSQSDLVLIGEIANMTDEPVFNNVLESALAINLEQSPFLNLYSRERVREMLRYMNRPPDELVTPAVAREICQRGGIKAYITGSIARLGRNYVISLEAVTTASGEAIAREQIEVDAKEKVLQALGQVASRMRGRLGESLPSIQRYDTPLLQATTSSLEALKAYSLGQKLLWSGRWLEAISHYKRAVELDPSFASAYDDMSYCYVVARKRELAAEAAQKAFSLRGRVSEYEKGSIEMAYYNFVTEEMDKTIAVASAMRSVYPRNTPILVGLGEAYMVVGSLEKALEVFEEAMRLGEDRLAPVDLASVYLYMNRIPEAKTALGKISAADNLGLHFLLFQIAVLEGDSEAMAKQIEWARGRPEELFILHQQANAAASAGKMSFARELNDKAIELAQRREMIEAAADFSTTMARTEALMGNCKWAIESGTSLLAEQPEWQSIARAATALAICGEVRQTEPLAAEIARRGPKGTLANGLFLPVLRAAAAIARGDGQGALQALGHSSPYGPVSIFWTGYFRGQAYLLLRNGAAAAVEFQRIIDNRCQGILSPLYPLAHIGLARASALAGEKTKSQKAYQDLFALWKEADPGLPILQQARQEYRILR